MRRHIDLWISDTAVHTETEILDEDLTCSFVCLNPRDSVAVNAPPGTVVGEFKVDHGPAPQLEVLDSHGGIFIADGASLVIGAKPDFEGPVMPGTGVPNGVPHYVVPCRVTLWDGTTQDFSITVRPAFAKIAPTGDETGNLVRIDTIDTPALRAALQSPEPNRTIEIGPDAIGTFEVNANSSTIVTAENLTVRSHRRAIMLKDYGPIIRGPARNQIWEYVSFRVGNDPAGRSLVARDSLGLGGPVDTIVVRHFDASWGVDENIGLAALAQRLRPRRILFERGLIAEPLFNAGHPEGAHPMGILVVDHTMDIVFNKCAIIGNPNRSPEIGASRGALIQNCVVAYGGGGGFTCSSPWAAEPSNNLGATAVWRNNLMLPATSIAYPLTEAKLKARAFWLTRIGTGSFLHQTGNHFFKHDGQDFVFDPDPVKVPEHVTLTGGSTASVFSDELPFIPADYDLMPTDTAEERRALFDDVMDNCGNREPGVSGDAALSEIGHRIVTNFRAGIFTRPNSPADVGGYVTGIPS